MAGASKKRAQQERKSHHAAVPSSNGESSSSGKASGSAPRPGPLSPSQSNASVHSSLASRAAFDGNRDPETPGEATRNPNSSAVIVNPRNLDLGMGAWSVVRGHDLPTDLPRRPAQTSKLGREIVIGLNTFNVDSFPTQKVYQFNIMIGSGAEKRGLITRVWNSKAMKDAIGPGWVFDGNALAWHFKKLEREVRIVVDLDAEQGRTVRPNGRDNKHRVVVRQTNEVRFDQLMEHLQGKTNFDNSCLEAINFADHLMRVNPSSKYTQIKRSYFARGQNRFPLGGGVEAFRGVYQSLRTVAGASGGSRLSVNVDSANGTFWVAQLLSQAAAQVAGKRDVNDLIAALRQGEKSSAANSLKRLRKQAVLCTHRGAGQVDRYIIDRFIYQDAKSYKFPKFDEKTKTETKVSIYDYFAKTYNVRLQFPDLPLVKMTKGKCTVLPMEILKLEENQRYVFKMDERQTANMIKFAVTPPSERWTAIQHGLKMLDWPTDPYLKNYGMQINPEQVKVKARLLQNPKVGFTGAPTDPKTSGRWDLKGKKFLLPNTKPLKSWGVCVITGRRGGKPDKAIIENFIREFIKIYIGHGGKVENKNPAMSLASGDDVGAWVTAVWNSAGNQSQTRPQMLVFILPDKDANTYGRIKRSAECRYGVVSQCMQYAHVQKAQAQYISNVCMKFNAKLGGVTAKAVGPKSGINGALGNVPTLIIGADVSHAAPGAQTPSMAAMTVSMDKLATRYAATCETNGFRVEMITTDNINSMLKPMIQEWVRTVGGGQFPGRIIYFRDGVSEGQYQHVLQQEVHDMKELLRTASPKLKIPFVVVVGSKRHNVRFFPAPGTGDRNGNPLPGTLVEHGVTHPFDNDFYLCAHAAIKGTARPVHYYVLANEAGMSNEELHTLVYEHSYQYIRATTPVSIFPAIYYAHIVSNRAVPHDPKWGGSSNGAPTVTASHSRSGSQSGSQGGDAPGSSGVPSDFEKLMPMPNQGGINTDMWYI